MSKKLGELFQAANPVTAYSFQRVASDLDVRFAELNEEPFSWYPATKAPYAAVNGSVEEGTSGHGPLSPMTEVSMLQAKTKPLT